MRSTGIEEHAFLTISLWSQIKFIYVIGSFGIIPFTVGASLQEVDVGGKSIAFPVGAIHNIARSTMFIFY